MGKYMKKAKAACEVAVMEVAAQSPLGVRTRARTLALQKNDSDDSASYLQLRSRRLEKPKETPCSYSNAKLDSKPSNSPKSRRNASAAAAAAGESAQSCEKVGENVLEADSRSRDARETTPSSLIRDAETIRTPSSTTRPTTSTATRMWNSVNRSIPTTHEMEEFFAGAEQLQQRIFAEKYNFDPVNDLPLPGRYEWVRVDS